MPGAGCRACAGSGVQGNARMSPDATLHPCALNRPCTWHLAPASVSKYPPVPGFRSLLQLNRNFRYAWISQVISEIGDHFNNIAVFSLALASTRAGLVVSGVMLARAVSAVLAAPVAGVVLDRFDRRKVMM